MYPFCYNGDNVFVTEARIVNEKQMALHKLITCRGIRAECQKLFEDCSDDETAKEVIAIADRVVFSFWEEYMFIKITKEP